MMDAIQVFKDVAMKTFLLLTTLAVFSVCSGCVSIASYAFTENGCVKNCKKEESMDYFLGSRLSYKAMTSPQADPGYTKEIALKSLFALDFPLTVAADTVLAPFIAVRNAVK